MVARRRTRLPQGPRRNPQAFATGIGPKTAYGLGREFHCLLQLAGRLTAYPRSRSTVSDYRAGDIKIVEDVATAGEARFKVGRSGLSR